VIPIITTNFTTPSNPPKFSEHKQYQAQLWKQRSGNKHRDPPCQRYLYHKSVKYWCRKDTYKVFLVFPLTKITAVKAFVLLI